MAGVLTDLTVSVEAVTALKVEGEALAAVASVAAELALLEERAELYCVCRQVRLGRYRGLRIQVH